MTTADHEKVPGDRSGRKPPSRRFVARILEPLDGVGTVPMAIAAAAGVGSAAESLHRDGSWPLAVMQGVGTFLGAIGVMSRKRRTK